MSKRQAAAASSSLAAANSDSDDAAAKTSPSTGSSCLPDRGLKRVRRLLRLSLPPFEDGRDWDKGDVIDIFHWLKQFLAIAAGVVCGLFGITGWPGFVLGMGAVCLLSHMYLRSSKIPDDAMSDGEAFQEGLMPAIMTLTLFWTITNTLLHG